MGRSWNILGKMSVWCSKIKEMVINNGILMETKTKTPEYLLGNMHFFFKGISALVAGKTHACSPTLRHICNTLVNLLQIFKPMKLVLQPATMMLPSIRPWLSLRCLLLLRLMALVAVLWNRLVFRSRFVTNDLMLCPNKNVSIMTVLFEEIGASIRRWNHLTMRKGRAP